ncbi:MAG: hypothetical protein AAB492_05015, partial [Patescibacteria group bacterium]
FEYMEFLKESFLKTYANTPISLRDDIVLVLEKTGPISWYTAYLEIKNDTNLSKEILKGLRELKLI